MANYFYVKSSGTGGTRYTSQQTGTFPTDANSFSTINGALGHGTPPVAGDFICCLSTSKETSASNTVITPVNGTTIISVNGTNCENYEAGYEVETTSIAYIDLNHDANNESCSYWGIEFDAANLCMVNRDHGAFTEFRNCTVRAGQVTPASGEVIRYASGAGYTRFINCTFDPPDVASASVIQQGNNATIEIIGGSIASNTTKPDFLIGRYGSTTKSIIRIDGLDLSNMDTNFNIIDATNFEETHEVVLTGCKFPSSWTVGETTSSNLPYVVDIIDCETGANHYYSAKITGAGYWETVTSVYETSAATIDGQNVSFEIVTNASTRITEYMPLKVLVGRVHADFSTAKTISVELAHDAQGSGTSSRTTDAEVWIEAHLPANNTDVQRTFQSGYRGGGDPFDAASDNTTSSDVWTGESFSTATYDTISITTPGSQGEGWADVYVCIAIASVTAGDMYVSSEISVT